MIKVFVLATALAMTPAGMATAQDAGHRNFQTALQAYDRGDYAEAVRLWRMAADQGNAHAQTNLGIMYATGQIVPKNFAEAVRLWRMAADQGVAEAQRNLGIIYENGQGVPQSDAEAVRWYRMAADQGLPTAQNALGLMYLNGRGVPFPSTLQPDDDNPYYAEALQMFRLAADQGNADAQINLGAMYANGLGIPHNYDEAVHWYERAADQGGAKAQYNLGLFWYGVQNFVEAVRLYRLAADQGYADAQNNLGLMHANGRGVPQNYAEAVRWYRMAADQGNAQAQFNLGFMYDNGRGVPQSDAEALRLFRLAADQGVAEAQDSLESTSDDNESHSSLIRCRQNSCSYVRILNSHDQNLNPPRDFAGGARVIKVVEEQYGYSEHQNGEYPRNINESSNIRWSKDTTTHYYICDRDYPAIISPNDPESIRLRGGNFRIEYPSLLQTTTAHLPSIHKYINVCHSLNVNIASISVNESSYRVFLDRLGYSEFYGHGVENYTVYGVPSFRAALEHYFQSVQESADSGI
jgi:TPR repeat protein